MQKSKHTGNKNKHNEKSTIKRCGTITKLFGSMYEVVDDEAGFKIMATLSGKMRMHSIKLTVGDKVEVELSEYDLTKGRIVYRMR